MISRRTFLIQSSLAALAAGCGSTDQRVEFADPMARGPAPPIGSRPSPDTHLASVLGRALDTAKRGVQRMPNVSLLPDDKPLELADLIGATDSGILVTGDGSWSIDQQRYNFQFGGQMFYAIEKGKVKHALKDVAYQSNSLDFWKSCDMIGGKQSFQLHGSLYDGKGEPGQSNAVSHGCPPARFRQVNVLNTSRRGGA